MAPHPQTFLQTPNLRVVRKWLPSPEQGWGMGEDERTQGTLTTVTHCFLLSTGDDCFFLLPLFLLHPTFPLGSPHTWVGVFLAGG